MGFVKLSESLKSELLLFARKQHGYFTAFQAEKAGYLQSNHQYHINQNNWVKISNGLYRLPGYSDSMESDFVRWSLWSRNQQDQPQGIISHRSALAYHGYAVYDSQVIHLTVPPRFRKKRPPEITIHKASLSLSSIESSDGIMVTRLGHTLVDMRSELEKLGEWDSTIKKIMGDNRLSYEEIEVLSLNSKAERLGDRQINSIYDPISEGVWKMISNRTEIGQRRSRAGFTLVELLVVIAIISILAAMLMPALNSAMDSARTIACLNNLKQISIAQIHYADNCNGWIWFAGFSSAYDTWSTCLAGGNIYKQPDSYIVDKNTFCCPGSIVRTYKTSYNTYGMYKCRMDHEYISKGYKFANPDYSITIGKIFYLTYKIPSPSSFIMHADSFCISPGANATEYLKPNWAYSPNTQSVSNPKIHCRHNYKANCGFVDGHAHSMSPERMRGSVTQVKSVITQSNELLLMP